MSSKSKKKLSSTMRSCPIADKLDKITDSISRMKDAFNERKMSSNSIEIECWLELLGKYIADAMRLQSELEVADPLNDDRGELECLCVSTKALYLAALNKLKGVNAGEQCQGGCTPSHRSNLPKLSLPKFSGKHAEFKSFISLYESLVDNDTHLTNIEKFNHLVSCLSGPALSTVEAFCASDENYPKALARLKSVYDKKGLILFDTISQLYDIPEMHKASSASLRTILDKVSAIYDSLLSLGDDKVIVNAILIHIALSKVDAQTKSKFEEQVDYNEFPVWSACVEILNRRYQQLSAEESSKSKPNQNLYSKKSHKSSFTCAKANPQQKIKCTYCKSGDHYITDCNSFSALPVTQRFDFTKKSQLCINCLRKGHTVSKCRLPKCSICSGDHNKLLHIFKQSAAPIVSTQPDYTGLSVEPTTSVQAQVNHASSTEEVILATAVIKIKDRCGNFQIARALLDSGSQVNFMTEDLAQQLRLERENKHLNLVTIGRTTSNVKYRVNTTCKSRLNSFQFTTDFWVLRNISSFQPERKISFETWNIPSNIVLADPGFNTPQRVDLLLGAGTFFDLLCVGQIELKHNLPRLQKTLFGWIISGKCKGDESLRTAKCNLMVADDSNSLDSIVQRFWQLDNVPQDSKAKRLTAEQQACEENFRKTLRILPSGRFEVTLPFKAPPESLGSSFETAKRRFLGLERRTQKDPKLREMYIAFMKEYIALGHMSLIDGESIISSHYYIPHQCVLRPESTTTKLRVVFDASAKTSSAVSLNDILMVGPTIQRELYSTLLRFRLHKYALTADISKMYRQVQISNADRAFQLILWREFPDDDIGVYQLNTVTYGTASAPFLAIRCLKELGEMHKLTQPIGAEVICSDFYVDDMLTGADSWSELNDIRQQVITVLRSGGFHLAKWFSNHPDYFEFQETEKTLRMNDADFTKTLGMHWCPRSDTFKFRLDASVMQMKATKRNILSVTARLFDPLGLLCPVITKAKILLQELWRQKLDWDESIPASLSTEWNHFRQNLLDLNRISLPRHMQTRRQTGLQIHGFADASISAYGCSLYIRVESEGTFSSRILTAKSRVAPIKVKTIPRLELCAAHILAKLWSQVKPLLTVGEIESVNFWTDSEITLHWIRSHSSHLSTFVGNRVSDIQELTDGVIWRHVPSEHNPADIVSRGCDVQSLQNSIWFIGPQFLSKAENHWPTNKHFDIPFELKNSENRKSVAVYKIAEMSDNAALHLVTRQSSYAKLLRILSYVYRFVNGKRCQYTSIIPSSDELRFAFLKLVEVVQTVDLREEIDKLQKSQLICSHLQKLNPFLHKTVENGKNLMHVRVGGRLFNAPLPHDSKFPLLLSKGSHFVTLYLRHLHLKNYHAGAKVMIALLRQQIWLVNAREACTKIVRQCVHCFRYKPKLQTQIMGNLPGDRLKALRPFLISGVDFFGPVFVKAQVRGRPPTKMYVAVFVCFSSKAVHLELVTDLSTDAFLSIFRRFIARRGAPRRIYCDNATNFVGASNLLKELAEKFAQQQEKLLLFAAEKGVEFEFIPPRAPHFGGLWEAAVKAAKHRLIRATGAATLTLDEMMTFLAEIEALLNSRPIAPISSDPNDGEALTPGHLLIGEPLVSLPVASEPDVPSKKLHCLRKWQLLCVLKQRFWQQWSKDYILSLQARHKWQEEQPNLSIGDLVLIHDDNLPTQRWLTGRVVAVMQGDDGKVRVVDVKRSEGILRRPVHKLARLPVGEMEHIPRGRDVNP